MKTTSTVLRLSFLFAVCAGASLGAQAQDRIYRCPGNEYTNNATAAQQRGCKLVEGGIARESQQAMQNIKDLLAEHGHSMSDIVKCTVMLADIKEWPAFNEVYRGFFDKRYPARSAFAGSGLALGARVEVECIAVVGQAGG